MAIVYFIFVLFDFTLYIMAVGVFCQCFVLAFPGSEGQAFFLYWSARQSIIVMGPKECVEVGRG